jgi:hypothetical protein
MKCAHVSLDRLSITPFRMVRSKLRITWAISKKTPRSSHSICSTCYLANLVKQMFPENLNCMRICPGMQDLPQLLGISGAHLQIEMPSFSNLAILFGFRQSAVLAVRNLQTHFSSITMWCVSLVNSQWPKQCSDFSLLLIQLCPVMYNMLCVFWYYLSYL